ncbi:MAG: hypothetical protein WCO06_01360 [Candidatus Roizmanbacteria bacterium]
MWYRFIKPIQDDESGFNWSGKPIGDLSINKNTFMQNGIFKLVKENISSAIVYGVVAVLLVIISKGTIFGLDWKVLADVGILAVISSLVKNLLTTESGKFANLVKVIPEVK